LRTTHAPQAAPRGYLLVQVYTHPYAPRPLHTAIHSTERVLIFVLKMYTQSHITAAAKSNHPCCILPNASNNKQSWAPITL